jgi:cytochrome c peroxidase
MACATCHDPRFAYGPPNALPVQRGGPELKHSGLRAVPSLRYLQGVPPFTEHYEDDEQGGADQGPTGGLTWDGRASSAHDQARLPLLSPFEMANASPEAVVAKVERGPYAGQLRRMYGVDVFIDRARAFDAIVLALEVFQQNPADFAPYTSKYDRWLRGKAELTAEELHGLALFEDPRKGNCASCHPSRPRGGAAPQFSDFGYVALGVPRNAQIPVNADVAFHDLGLCGPDRKDLADHPEYCGMFRAPSLRNVAARQTFFHNGVFHSLRQVLEFYVERDLRPAKWYPGDQDGGVRVFDDLPAQYRDNVSHEPPLDRKRGDAPALSGAEIDALMAFLQTLTDADVARSRSLNASSVTARGNGARSR